MHVIGCIFAPMSKPWGLGASVSSMNRWLANSGGAYFFERTAKVEV